MSDAQVEKRSRGRPKKAEEDKIQDLNAYKREWNKAHKNDPELIEKRKLQHHIANRRRMDLYTLIKKLASSDEILSLSPDTVKEIRKLTLTETEDF